MKLKYSRFLKFGLVALSTTICLHSHAKYYYGTYSHAPQGSARALGLGGAYTGLSDDAAGVIYNPAGLALGNFHFDVGKTDNFTFNKETDINNDGILDGVPFQYQFNSFALKLGSLAMAIAISTPYQANMIGTFGSFQTAQIQILSQDLILAYQLASSISLGVLARSETLKESYFQVGSPAIETSSKASSYILGFSYRPEKTLGFGISYTPKTVIDIDTNINQKISSGFTDPTSGWFQGIVFPQKITLGGFYGGSENIVYIADLDFITAPENTVYVKSPFTTSANTFTQIKTYTFQIPHGGIEFTLLKDDKKKFIWRVGGYREPARVVGADDRLHVTMGVEVRMGPIVASASMDETNGFSNSSQAISLTIGDK